jgi:hypothetical protein
VSVGLFSSHFDSDKLRCVCTNPIIIILAEHFPFDFEQWFEPLKDITMSSVIIPLEIADAVGKFVEKTVESTPLLLSQQQSIIFHSNDSFL